MDIGTNKGEMINQLLHTAENGAARASYITNGTRMGAIHELQVKHGRHAKVGNAVHEILAKGLAQEEMIMDKDGFVPATEIVRVVHKHIEVAMGGVDAIEVLLAVDVDEREMLMMRKGKEERKLMKKCKVKWDFMDAREMQKRKGIEERAARSVTDILP